MKDTFSKKELEALGFEEDTTGGMKKYYPANTNNSLEYIGHAIFTQVAVGDSTGYIDRYQFMCLSRFDYLEMEPKAFLKAMRKAVDEYRSDMKKLGLLEEKE